MDPKKKEAYLRALASLREKYKKADDLYEQGKYKKAAEIFRGCIEWAAEKNFPMTYGMFVDLLSRVAECFEALDYRDQAFPLYLAAEGALQDYEDSLANPEITRNSERAQLWNKIFPAGVKLRRESRLDLTGERAKLYASIALLHDRLGHAKPAEEYFEKSIGINLDAGRMDAAAETIYLSAQARHQNKEWPALVEMADALVEISQRVQNRELIAAGFRFLGIAHIKMDKEFLGLGFFADGLNVQDSTFPEYAKDKAETIKLIDKLIVRARNMNSVESLGPMVDAARVTGHAELADFEQRLNALQS
jgi:tetratricopeptide (TPR) repeat protein